MNLLTKSKVGEHSQKQSLSGGIRPVSDLRVPSTCASKSRVSGLPCRDCCGHSKHRVLPAGKPKLHNGSEKQGSTPAARCHRAHLPFKDQIGDREGCKSSLTGAKGSSTWSRQVGCCSELSAVYMKIARSCSEHCLSARLQVWVMSIRWSQSRYCQLVARAIVSNDCRTAGLNSKGPHDSS